MPKDSYIITGTELNDDLLMDDLFASEEPLPGSVSSALTVDEDGFLIPDLGEDELDLAPSSKADIRSKHQELIDPMDDPSEDLIDDPMDDLSNDLLDDPPENSSEDPLSIPMDNPTNDGALLEGTDKEDTEFLQYLLKESLFKYGKPNMSYLCAMSELSPVQVINTLKGSIFYNPTGIMNRPEEDFTDPAKEIELLSNGWETAEDFLSGNLNAKLDLLRAALRKGAYTPILKSCLYEGVQALIKNIPPAILYEDIYITLGSPWIPEQVIRDFALEHLRLMVEVKHDYITGSWELTKNNHRVLTPNLSYQTKRIDAQDLLSKTLNMQTVAIYDELLTNSGRRKVLNEPETILALEKQRQLIQAFATWVWEDKERRLKLADLYNNLYGGIVPRSYDGSFLRFPGLAEGEALLPYQKNAVARILLSPNTLLAHDVGAGKTYVMITSGMILRQTGRSTKNLYLVPNNITGQWEEMYLRLYPHAKLLVVDPKTFAPEGRQNVLATIRDGDYDAIIMAYSCFELIPLSKAARIRQLSKQISRITSLDARHRTKASDARERFLNKQLQDLYLGKFDRKTGEILETKEYTGICFDELGFTGMFIDEAHNFKNVPLETKITRVLGINSSGSKRCQQMLEKIRHIQAQNGGGGIVMATGTPITNSITDVFTLQRYLQQDEIIYEHLDHFDSWVGMFAERGTEFEIDVDTSSYRLTTRLTKFHNLPELTALLSEFADFHQVDVSIGLPAFDGYTDEVVPRSSQLSQYLKTITRRAERVRAHEVKAHEDNMLKITTDGRKAALDVRLVQEELPVLSDSKAVRCADRVFQIYLETLLTRSTQLIFCDTSTPKEGFNVYSELRRLLIMRGVEESEIAFVHDADTEAKRKRLFEQMRNGDIRILLGSTFKLGMGVNVQNRLIALHHLDIPWRPADMIQREGRILRQGNENSRVQIFRYITEGSFDAYSWQLLETKQRFIHDLLSGSLSERGSSDIENTVLSYAEVKALAVGNPLVKKRVELCNELTRIGLLVRKSEETRQSHEHEVAVLEAKLPVQMDLIITCRLDAEYALTTMKDSSLLTELEQLERKNFRENLHAQVLERAQSGEDYSLGEYRGFEVILPSNLIAGAPTILLRRKGEYSIEIGTSESGQLMRIDNFLNNLRSRLAAFEEGYEKMDARLKGLQELLQTSIDYTPRIDSLNAQIAEVDRQLGVNWNDET